MPLRSKIYYSVVWFGVNESEEATKKHIVSSSWFCIFAHFWSLFFTETWYIKIKKRGQEQGCPPDHTQIPSTQKMPYSRVWVAVFGPIPLNPWFPGACPYPPVTPHFFQEWSGTWYVGTRSILISNSYLDVCPVTNIDPRWVGHHHTCSLHNTHPAYR